jgi:hypothetical protein
MEVTCIIGMVDYLASGGCRGGEGVGWKVGESKGRKVEKGGESGRKRQKK